MFWRTGCVFSERICGARQRHSEPEASPEGKGQGRSDWRASTAEPAGRTAVEVATRTAKPRPVQAKLEAALPVDRAKPKTPGVERAVPVTTTGHCPVPVLPRRAKTSFPGRGPLRYAPWSFPPGISKS